MKIIYSIFLFLTFLSFSSCSDREELQQNEMIEVVFKTNRVTTTKTEVGDDLSVITFKYTDKGSFSLFENGDNTNWEADGDGSITKKIILPTGKYRFLMARGLSLKQPVDDCIAFMKDEAPVGGYDGDYYFKYPSELDATGELLLKKSPTELFVDANASGFDSNDTEYSLFEGNKFSISRKITRLQGRMDLMVRRGEKGADNKWIPIAEGANNELARANALKKIESIQVTLVGPSLCCHVSELKLSNPGKYVFNSSSDDFVSFQSSDFVKDLNDVEPASYACFDNSAYRKGELLFPAPENADVGLKIVINYELPLKAKKIEKEVAIERNRVALVILWLINEEVGADVDITVSQDDLIFGSGEAQGDDGFWN